MKSVDAAKHFAVSLFALATLLAPQAWCEVFDNRAYLFGDPTPGEADLEDGGAGTALGSGNVGVSPGFTLDGTGPSGDYFDLSVSGNPMYVDASSRPGTADSLGASFDGDDYLSTADSINLPAVSWLTNGSSTNQTGILSHGIQLWARPTAPGTGVLQDIVVDTPEHGIYITEDDDWGYFYDDVRRDTNVDVQFGQWSHVMTLAGFQDPAGGHANGDGVILLNGVAIAAFEGEAELDFTALYVGAWDDPDDDPDAGPMNFYQGDLDDVRFFMWGDNRYPAPYGGGVDGQNFGTLNLGEDNEWIVNQLSVLGITEVADANLDTVVNAADATFLAANWGAERLVGGYHIGDWTSRQNGDINYDGVVDLADAYLLNDAIVAAGGEPLDFAALFGGAVPEPNSLFMCLALIAGGGLRRRSRPTKM